MAGEEQFMAGFAGGIGAAGSKKMAKKMKRSQRAAMKKAGGPSKENRARHAKNRKRQRNLFGRIKANVDQGE